MSSFDSLRVKELLKKGIVVQHGTDQSVAIRLRKIGSESATSVTVQNGTDLVLIGSTTTDTFLFSTNNDMGKLEAAINATGRWEAKILDTLRTQDPDNLKNGVISSSTDGNGVVIWDVVEDSSDADSLQLVSTLSPFRNFDAPKGHRVVLKELRYSVNMGTAAAESVQIWQRRGSVETQLFGQLSVDTTDTTITFASGEGEISGNPDDELICLVKDASTLADAAGNFVRASGFLV